MDDAIEGDDIFTSTRFRQGLLLTLPSTRFSQRFFLFSPALVDCGADMLMSTMEIFESLLSEMPVGHKARSVECERKDKLQKLQVRMSCKSCIYGQAARFANADELQELHVRTSCTSCRCGYYARVAGANKKHELQVRTSCTSYMHGQAA